jgi:hypothetical protein
VISVITITGIGDHFQPVWLITFTGMRNRPTLVRLAAALRRDAAVIKDALVAAVARRHPDRPYDITPRQYAACRAFLRRFDHIFTLN